MSEENYLDEVIDDIKNEDGGLPQFLNVLTILTFIGSGLTILSNIWSFLTLSSQRAQIEQSRELMDGFGDGAMGDLMDGAIKTMENGPLLYSVGLLTAVACLYGALQMRKLKKSGYYIYVAASVASVIVPLVVVGGGLMGGMIIFGSIFTIAFVVMYSLNLKHLK